MRSILLLLVAPLSLTVVSGLFIAMQYIFYGPNWATDIIGMTIGCFAAVTMTESLAKNYKNLWLAYAFSFCLIYSGLNWFLVIFHDEQNFMPLGLGSLIGALWGLIETKRAKPPVDCQQ